MTTTFPGFGPAAFPTDYTPDPVTEAIVKADNAAEWRGFYKELYPTTPGEVPLRDPHHPSEVAWKLTRRAGLPVKKLRGLAEERQALSDFGRTTAGHPAAVQVVTALGVERVERDMAALGELGPLSLQRLARKLAADGVDR